MSEGIKVKVFPVLDEQAFNDLINQINSRLGDVSSAINDGMSSIGTASASNGTTVNPTVTSRQSDEAKTEVAEGVKDGLKKSADEDEPTTNKRNKGITDAIDKFFESFDSKSVESKGLLGAMKGGLMEAVPKLAMMLSIVSAVYDVTLGLWEKTKDSSPALKNIMGMVENAFNLILMPIGNIIAIELMPTLQSLYRKLGDWFGKAMDIYDKEGWAGLINEALDVFGDMFITLLGGLLDVLAPIFGELLWKILASTNMGRTFMSGFGSLEKFLDTISKIWNDVGTNVTGFFKDVSDFFTDFDIGRTISNWWSSIDWGNIWSGLVTDLTSALGSIFNIDDNFVRQAQDTIDPFHWFHADGGIITSPTLTSIGYIGEEQPEALLPLDYLNNLLEDRSKETIDYVMPILDKSVQEAVQNTTLLNTSSNQTIGGDTYIINNTINVTSDNAEDVGKELKRLLDKSTGKITTLF